MNLNANSHRWVWKRLGIAPTADSTEIRRAYVRRLKAIDPDQDPDAFIALREAWEEAKRLAAYSSPSLLGDEQVPPAHDRPKGGGGVGDAAAPASEIYPDVEAVIEELPLHHPPDGHEQAALPSAELRPEKQVAPAHPRASSGRNEEAGVDLEDEVSSDAEAVIEELPLHHPSGGPPPRASSGRNEGAWPEGELFQRLDGLLMAGGEAELELRLAEATRALLAHPSLDRIPVADGVERWLTGRIDEAWPRSDPVLEVAAAHFGWAEKAEDWAATYFLQWAGQRLEDLAFERRLVARLPRFGPVLTLLRSPAVPPDPDAVRRLGPDVRDLAEYAGTHHRTTIDSFDPAMRQWWNAHFRDRSWLGRQWDDARRLLRGFSSIQSAMPVPPRRPSGLQFLGLLVLPFLFAWTTLRRGYSPLVRAAAFGWMGILLYLAVSQAPPPPPPAPAPMLVATPAAYGNAMEDLSAPIDAVLGGEDMYMTLQLLNPELSAQLMARWQQAKRLSEEPEVFAAGVDALLDRAYRERVAGGGPVLQAAHWQIVADRLKWLRQIAGPDACALGPEGDGDATFPAELHGRAQALMRRALSEAPPPGPSGRVRAGLDLSPRLLAEAARRSGLELVVLRRAVRQGGTADQRCAAQIGLIEAILAAPPIEQVPALASLSAGM